MAEKIDQLIKAITIDAVKDKAPHYQVNILNKFGFTQVEIAVATGMTQGNISKILSKSVTASKKRSTEGEIK